MTQGGGYLWPPRQASGCSGMESSGRDPALLPGLEQSRPVCGHFHSLRGMHPAALCTATEREKAFPVSAIKVRDFFESNVFKKKLSQRVGSKDTERNNRFQS